MMKTNGSFRCCSPNLSGYWKGYRCGSVGKFLHTDGKHYCASHLSEVINNPERIEKVKTQWEKSQKKLGRNVSWIEIFS